MLVKESPDNGLAFYWLGALNYCDLTAATEEGLTKLEEVRRLLQVITFDDSVRETPSLDF